MSVRNYNPAHGCAFQGDVAIIPVPVGIKINRTEEIMPASGRLILQSGEITGHHHEIVIDRRHIQSLNSANIEVERLMSAALDGNAELPRAKFFRDPVAVLEMVRRGILERADLATAFLFVEDHEETLVHPEHDGIRLPAGNGEMVQPDKTMWAGGYASQRGVYLISGQIESAGAEERKVQD